MDNKVKQYGLTWILRIFVDAELANKSYWGLPQTDILSTGVCFQVSTPSIIYLPLTLVSTPSLSSVERNNNVYLVLIIKRYLQSLKDQRGFKYDIIVTAGTDILYRG